MYNFSALTILLYLLAARLAEGEELLTTAQRSLEVFEAMSVHSVARKCTARMRAIFQIVKMRLSRELLKSATDLTLGASETGASPPREYQNTSWTQDDFLTKLIDSEMMQIFDTDAEFDRWIGREAR